jgi:hypothetical protein
MTQAVVQSTEDLVQRQAEIWQKTIDAAHQQWQQVTTASRSELEAGLARALQKSIHEHAAQLNQHAEGTQKRTERTWRGLLEALNENAQVMRSQQAEMAKQGDVMLKVVQATGEVVRMENALNKNLQSLAGAKNFEDTVMSLSAAIHLLNLRLNDDKTRVPLVSLDTPPSEERAA